MRIYKTEHYLEILEDESDDSDEDFLQNKICIYENNFVIMDTLFSRKKRNSILNYIESVVPNYEDVDFIKHFRVNRNVFNYLVERFESSNIYQEIRRHSRVKCARSHILLFLWYAGHEACGFHDISDRFNVSISTVHCIIKRVTYFISGLSEEFINWPNLEKQEEIARYYITKRGFPQVIGCIDGTHIVINPPRDAKDDYINRKGDISLVLQAICDNEKTFIDIFIGYPGSVHDARVFKNSPIYKKLTNSCGGNERNHILWNICFSGFNFAANKFLLGDSAYPCSNVLITPFRDNGHLTRNQKNFNQKLSSCRIDIEHAFGCLKQRFRQLYFCKLVGIEYICHFTRACCVLHNMGKMEETELFTEPRLDGDLEVDLEPHQNVVDSAIGKALRNEICNQINSH